MDAPTQSIYPHSATLFAAISACVFATIGVFGKFSTQTHPLPYPKHHTIHTIYIINIAGNLITLLALLKSPTIREHATTAFVISLSISDLLFCSFSLPLTAVRFFQEVRMGAIATLILVLTYTYPFLYLYSRHRVGPLAAPCARFSPSSSMAMWPSHC